MSVAPSPVASKQSSCPAEDAWKTCGGPNGASRGFVVRIAERAAASVHFGAAEPTGDSAAATSTTRAARLRRATTRRA